ncbi:ATP-binding cassette domain-containing protein [Corynebacterium pseudodiphtheriticum]|uniref:ATP-binding cassette domain-containing protein n=1 Tax=Corynebacterium pseudodiphtheriticum TaxID=37637 RepID=UPI000F878706|nr:ATP-binding cassette domain-containing protein [Corynebacterium pseudodiphtheriticum]MDC7110761.1 ATP-binding cassette domain-containing protein [Corynebacterium pseudodiphtheriticum]MDK4206710.1 ATP-binding cassette domain-containing protein [Corynebacterium pseudodiphtheriticum]MDK4243673.1 ATP-binding cassette domain-containing protein [Corynebacterium pseudodiphtheriticum]MDK4278563.1 ATP-binding cassette domain-containing protein [Corynebacterium pseudodiphtheriticum]MDK4284225.1 ATP-b
MDINALHRQVCTEKFSHVMLADDHSADDRGAEKHGAKTNDTASNDAWQIAHAYYEFLRGEPAPAPRVVVLGYEIGSVVSHQRDTVIEEIAQPMEQQGIAAADMEPHCREILHQLGLEEFAHTHPAQLSGGQTRRMLVASFLAARPDIIIACEPTAGLDPDSARAVMVALREFAVSGAGMVLCLDYRHAADRSSLGLARIAPGAIVAEWSGIRARRRTPKRRWWQFAKTTNPAREFSSAPVDIQARAGAVCWLRGDNGAGKTTLLRQLAGITANTGADTDPDPNPDAHAAPNTKATVSLALQDPAAQVLDASASAMLNDDTLWKIISPRPDTTTHPSPELTGDTHPLDLSPSQLRLLQVAAVIAQRRQVVLLDEPDVGLTPADRRRLHALLHECLSGGAAVIMTCHDPSLLQDVATYAEVTEAKIARAAG